MSNTQLSALTASALISLYNSGVEDYNPAGYSVVSGFKSKSKAIEAIEAMCEAGSLAVAFDGDSAVIVDATPPNMPDDEEGDDAGEGDDEEGGDEEGGDDAAAHGDGKGEIAKSGFRYGSEAWLKANPRGTEAREAYRKARRKAARVTRKAAKATA